MLKLGGRAAFAILVAGLLAVASAHAAGPHDGEWLVELTTQAGQCRSTYAFPITVTDGVITGSVTGRTGTYAISGRMANVGRFEWTTSGGPDPGHFEGSIRDERSEGQWSTQSGCRGVLIMNKKKVGQ
jgi:hypothetical protein